MAIVMGVTFVFCIGDIDDVLASPTYEPFVQVFYNAMRSKAGATVMASIIAIMLVCVSLEIIGLNVVRVETDHRRLQLASAK